MGSNTIDAVCPCCETNLKIDLKTGEVIWLKEKPKPAVSLTDMVKGLDSKQKETEQLFKKRSETEKDRNRLLDEKFKEAQKNVDLSEDLPLRDIDLD
jgi:hypothetical protein